MKLKRDKHSLLGSTVLLVALLLTTVCAAAEDLTYAKAALGDEFDNNPTLVRILEDAIAESIYKACLEQKPENETEESWLKNCSGYKKGSSHKELQKPANREGGSDSKSNR